MRDFFSDLLLFLILICFYSDFAVFFPDFTDFLQFSQDFYCLNFALVRQKIKKLFQNDAKKIIKKIAMYQNDIVFYGKMHYISSYGALEKALLCFLGLSVFCLRDRRGMPQGMFRSVAEEWSGSVTPQSPAFLKATGFKEGKAHKNGKKI